MLGGEFIKLTGDIITSYIGIIGAIIGVGVWVNKKSISRITQVVEDTITCNLEEVFKKIAQVEKEVEKVKKEQEEQNKINDKHAKKIAYNHLLGIVKDYETKRAINVDPQSYDLMNLSQAITEYYDVGNGGKLGRNAKEYLEEMQKTIDNK